MTGIYEDVTFNSGTVGQGEEFVTDFFLIEVGEQTAIYIMDYQRAKCVRILP